MTDKDKTPPSPVSGGGAERPHGKAAGKKSRTSSLPATGERSDRLRVEFPEYKFGPVEIGDSETKEVRVKNTTKEFLAVEDFWTSIGQTRLGPRDGSEFSIAGASRDDIAPGGIASLPVTFTPKVTYPEDEKKMSRRSGRIALLDEDGATAGTVKVAAIARPPGKAARESARADETVGKARRGVVLQPTSYDEIVAQLRAARELFLGSDLEGARDLLLAVLDSWHKHVNEAKVGHRFRSYGFSRQHAVTLAGQAHDEINKLLMFPTPVGYELAISKTEVAEEVLRVMYGEAREARSLKALNDASLPSLAGDVAEEVGANAKRLVTDAAFAMGFSLGTTEGVYEAARDTVMAVGDAARLAVDLSKAFLTGGFIGMTLEALDKLESAARDTASALALLGPEVAKRWNEGSSYQQGHFRGEVVGYVVAQIAILVLTSGEAAAAQAGRWPAIVKALRTVNAMGDITEWAGLLERSKLPPGLARLRHAADDVPVPHGGSRPDVSTPDQHSAPKEPVRSETNAPSNPGRPAPSTNPWETGAEPGLPTTPQTLADGRCAMEAHPGYRELIAEAESKGFKIVPDHKAHVANIRVVNPAGEVLEWRREVHVIPGMRYLDLEHEIGHVQQLSRFGDNPPPTETLLRRADGVEVPAEGNLRSGTLDGKRNSIVEYHNRLVEWIRLAERGAPDEFLKQEAKSVHDWRRDAETGGLGHGGSNHRWAQQFFPDIPALEKKARQLGADIGRSNKRWETSS